MILIIGNLYFQLHALRNEWRMVEKSAMEIVASFV